MKDAGNGGAAGGAPAGPAPTPAPKRRWRRRIAIALAAAAALGVLGLAGSWALVAASASGRLYADASAIPHRRVAVVLGCVKTLPDGRSNQFFRARIRAAAALFRAGKADVLLVSGDNGRHGYDEPSDMRESLLAAGVPADRIVCDFAGFRTLDSAVRAKEVFGQSEVTFVSQAFHNERAIFIARARGLDAIGYNADDTDTVGDLKARARELLARAMAVLDVHVLGTRPKYLGPKVVIEAK